MNFSCYGFIFNQNLPALSSRYSLRGKKSGGLSKSSVSSSGLTRNSVKSDDVSLDSASSVNLLRHSMSTMSIVSEPNFLGAKKSADVSRNSMSSGGFLRNSVSTQSIVSEPKKRFFSLRRNSKRSSISENCDPLSPTFFVPPPKKGSITDDPAYDVSWNFNTNSPPFIKKWASKTKSDMFDKMFRDPCPAVDSTIPFIENTESGNVESSQVAGSIDEFSSMGCEADNNSNLVLNPWGSSSSKTDKDTQVIMKFDDEFDNVSCIVSSPRETLENCQKFSKLANDKELRMSTIEERFDKLDNISEPSKAMTSAWNEESNGVRLRNPSLSVFGNSFWSPEQPKNLNRMGIISIDHNLKDSLYADPKIFEESVYVDPKTLEESVYVDPITIEESVYVDPRSYPRAVAGLSPLTDKTGVRSSDGKEVVPSRDEGSIGKAAEMCSSSDTNKVIPSKDNEDVFSASCNNEVLLPSSDKSIYSLNDIDEAIFPYDEKETCPSSRNTEFPSSATSEVLHSFVDNNKIVVSSHFDDILSSKNKVSDKITDKNVDTHNIPTVHKSSTESGSQKYPKNTGSTNLHENILIKPVEVSHSSPVRNCTKVFLFWCSDLLVI